MAVVDTAGLCLDEAHMCKLLSQLCVAGEEERRSTTTSSRPGEERETDWPFDPLTSTWRLRDGRDSPGVHNVRYFRRDAFAHVYLLPFSICKRIFEIDLPYFYSPFYLQIRVSFFPWPPRNRFVSAYNYSLMRERFDLRRSLAKIASWID